MTNTSHMQILTQALEEGYRDGREMMQIGRRFLGSMGVANAVSLRLGFDIDSLGYRAALVGATLAIDEYEARAGGIYTDENNVLVARG